MAKLRGLRANIFVRGCFVVRVGLLAAWLLGMRVGILRHIGKKLRLVATRLPLRRPLFEYPGGPEIIHANQAWGKTLSRIPVSHYPADSILHGSEGIEIKGSRHQSGWQGHNAEQCWLMVFVFDANTSRDAGQGIEPKPFRFVKVVGAKLLMDDWQFSGRSATSRRTITASVKRSGFDKMEANWIYRA